MVADEDEPATAASSPTHSWTPTDTSGSNADRYTNVVDDEFTAPPALTLAPPASEYTSRRADGAEAEEAIVETDMVTPVQPSTLPPATGVRHHHTPAEVDVHLL